MITADVHMKRASGFSLEARIEIRRRITALYGPSGSGKTTLLRLIAGLERGTRDDKIEVTHDDTVWQDATRFIPPHERRVAYVFQQPQLFPHLSVRGNLDYGAKRARTAVLSRQQVESWLDLGVLLDKRPHQLSGGEAQRVAIGRALLGDARCILMDEPLGSIDQAARQRILPYLSRLHHELDLPVVYVSHSLDEVNYLADYVYLVDNGRIKGSGSIFETSASLSLARSEGDELAAVVECRAHDFDTGFQLAELTLGRHSLFVATTHMEIGESVRVRIPARDVSIALEPPGNTSILNILPATVDDVADMEQSPSSLVRLDIDGQHILARITRKSRALLHLAPGQSVFAQIKGVALLTDHDN